MRLWILSLVFSCACGAQDVSTNAPPAEAASTNPPPHVVFLVGEEEFRSEETMPLIGILLKREFGYKVSICYSQDMRGYVDPNNFRSLFGTENLATADLMVMYLRQRNLSDLHMEPIANYLASGRPVVGFRTSIRSFRYHRGNRWFNYNERFMLRLFGQKWTTHHGNVKQAPRTAVSILEAQRAHPILRGVEAFDCASWLYQLHDYAEDGEIKLAGDPEILLDGESLVSIKPEDFPRRSPVAWTKTYEGSDGTVGRVFYTSLGHPEDFKEPSMRRLAVQGIMWALGREADIPEAGANVRVPGRFAPNPAGFGAGNDRRFKFPRRPPYFYDSTRDYK